jgi:hypothetical protein
MKTSSLFRLYTNVVFSFALLYDFPQAWTYACVLCSSHGPALPETLCRKIEMLFNTLRLTTIKAAQGDLE